MSWAKWDKTLQPEPSKGPLSKRETHCGPVTAPLNAMWMHIHFPSQTLSWLGEEGKRKTPERLNTYPKEIGLTQKLFPVTFNCKVDIWLSTLIPPPHLSVRGNGTFRKKENSYRKEECHIFSTFECNLTPLHWFF